MCWAAYCTGMARCRRQLRRRRTSAYGFREARCGIAKIDAVSVVKIISAHGVHVVQVHYAGWHRVAFTGVDSAHDIGACGGCRTGVQDGDRHGNRRAGSRLGSVSVRTCLRSLK